jgi:hypothetical protein
LLAVRFRTCDLLRVRLAEPRLVGLDIIIVELALGVKSSSLLDTFEDLPRRVLPDLLTASSNSGDCGWFSSFIEILDN